MNNSDNPQQFSAWDKLQKLVELQGESPIDIANALDVKLSDYFGWQEKGVPQEIITAICVYFSLPEVIFTQQVNDVYELEQLIQSTQFPDNKDSLARRLAANKSSREAMLDLSGLLLSEMPEEIFTFDWLKALDMSGNKLENLRSELLLLDQLETLDISNNFINIFPAMLGNMKALKKLVYNNNPFKFQPQYRQSQFSIEQLKSDIDADEHTLVVVESITEENCRLLNEIRFPIESTHNAKITTLTNTIAAEEITAATMVIYLAESPEPQYIAQKAQVILATVTTSMLVPMIIAVKEERNLRPTDVREASIKQQLFATLGPLQLPISIVFQHHGFATEFKNTLKRITAQNDLPKIAIKQLELTNIGVYKQLTVEFEQQIAVLIGLNGAGKSTILKAIALAILGVELSGYDSDDFGSLLRIIGKEDTQTLWQPQGEITLTVHIDGNLFSNSIKIEYDNIKEKVVAHGRRFEPLIDDENQPLTLILGISEQRNIQSKATRLDMPTVTLPKPKDLLPLLDNNEQTCIAHFESWLANLAYKVSQGELQLRPQINISFAVFSALMDEIITFAGLTSVDPVKLWIDHQDPKQTVPLRLASQGYQAVMGWVGSIIQRMFEAYGNTLQPLHCPAIILIDEIDQLLHVKWQQRILNVLANEFFPNTQWIITTHSPMVVTGLNEHQVIQLRKEQDKLIAEPNAVDLWMWQYGDIVSRLFEVMPEPPQANIDYLEQQIEQLAQSPYKNQSQLTKLNDRLARAIKSREQADELFRESQKLRKQQDTLATLIKQLNQPKDSDK